jgi:hypothetical protein
MRLKSVVVAGGTLAMALAPASAQATPTFCGVATVCYDETGPGDTNVKGMTGVLSGGSPHISVGTNTTVRGGGTTTTGRGGAGVSGFVGGCAKSGTSDGQNSASGSAIAGGPPNPVLFVVGGAGAVVNGTPAGVVVAVPDPPYGTPSAGPAPPPACSP